MSTNTHVSLPPYFVSTHAMVRMQQRGIDHIQLEQALCYGRMVRAHGGTRLHVLGRREAQRHGENGLNLSGAEGVHILMSEEGTVITVYRNHELRSLRLKKQHPRHFH